MESIGNPMGVVAEKKPDEPEKKPDPVIEPKKQEQVYVQVMDCDMKDNFFGIGHSDLFDFTNKFVANEYSYHVGGVFGSPRTQVNEGKPDWYKVFSEKAAPIKKTRANFYIDMTDPMETIKEMSDRIRVNYPDLIVGF